MSKIICDVCGTSYPETASQCPICGSAKQENKTVSVDLSSQEASESGSYNYVKGGRFSKANVRKRNQANKASEEARPAPRQSASRQAAPQRAPRNQVPREEPAEQDNRGLIIAVIVLAIAIVGVLFYIWFNFFRQETPDVNKPNNTGESTSQTTTSSTTTESTVLEIPCVNVVVSDEVIELYNVGSVWQLQVTASPADTTDTVIFNSSDEAVVTVSEAGLVTAVGYGEAEITITCGDVVKTVSVTFQEQTEPDPTETDPIETIPPTTAPPAKEYVLQFNGYNPYYYDRNNQVADITVEVGKPFTLQLMEDGEYVYIAWTTSSSVVSIDGNKVTANSKADLIYITGWYEGVKYTWKVRIK